MEDWQKDWFSMIETVAKEVEKLFTDISDAIDEALDTIATDSEEFITQLQTNSEEFITQFQSSISTELEQFFNEVVEPVFEVYLDLDLDFDEVHFENDWPITDWVEPSTEFHPACVGCRHFHGQMYAGNLLVCAMHPYGSLCDTCPDWEAGSRDF